MVFDGASIGPNINNFSITLEAILTTQAYLGFPGFSYFHTLEIDNALPANTPTSTKHSKSIKTLHPISDQPNVKDKNISSTLLNIFDDLDNNISATETLLPSTKTDMLV